MTPLTSRAEVATSSPSIKTLPPEQLARFSDLIEDRCGLHFNDGQRAALSAAIRTRMEQLGMERIEDYYDQLRVHASSATEDGFRKLINLVTITETCFFRDPAQFRLLRQILPALLAERARRLSQASHSSQASQASQASQGGQPTLRIWSAGCSTGAEAYSVALTLSEMGLYLANPKGTFEIIGTDVNTEALDKAGQGVYSRRTLRNVEGTVLQRYFRPEGRQFRLKDEIRQCVRFQYGNLNEAHISGPAAGLDIVFFKNVAIYFRPEVTRRLVRQLHDRLNDGGYLLLGHSESLWQISEQFTLVEHQGGFGYRKRISSPAPGFSPEACEPTEHIETDPLSAAAGQYDRCMTLFRAGGMADAEALLHTLIESSPTFVPAHLLLGGVYAHRGRYEEAFKQAEHALRLSDLEPRAYLLVGMIAARMGRQDEALQALRQALYLDDSLALAHFWLGNFYRDRNDIERACHEYQSVVRDWERHTLVLTEEFASDLSAEQLVDFCRQSSQRLRAGA
jgi:chemotaxis protein methyltransferase CheR